MLNKNLFIILVACCMYLPLKAQGQERPNIIFILTDDQRWDALGYAGNDIIHTPNMDELAAQGCYFANSFVTTPICAASRASIMTGMYERSHGFTFGTPPLAKEFAEISYPALLKAQGYHNGFIGKFGMNYEEKFDTSLFEVFERPGEQFWATTYFRLNKDHTWFRHLTEEIGDLSSDFISTYADKGPFCLSISFHAPHAEDLDPRQYIYPLDMEELYQDVTIPPPLLYDEKYFNAQPEYVRNGLNKVRWYWRFATPEMYQEKVKGYYRMISGIDKQLGRLRAQLRELGIADNTIIIFMGDNGYFLGERRLAGKWLLYENSLRVPFIVYDPRSGHKNTDIMALNIDVAPTILDYAGIEIPEMMQGKSVRPVVEADQWDTELRDHFMCEHLFNHDRIPKSEGVRTGRFKYFRYIDDPDHEEMYDLEADPLEIENLATDLRYRSILEVMREMLAGMKKTTETVE